MRAVRDEKGISRRWLMTWNNPFNEKGELITPSANDFNDPSILRYACFQLEQAPSSGTFIFVNF